MSHPIARRIVRANPAILTVVVCLGWLVWVTMLATASSPLLLGLGMGLQLLVVGAWVWAIFTVCTPVASPLRSRILAVVFVVPAVLAFFAGTMRWPTHNSPVAFAVIGLLGVGLWFAARALETREDAASRPSLGGTGSAMLLMYISVLGVWVLRPRLLRAAREVVGPS